MAALIEAAGPFRLHPQECDSPFRHLAEAIVSQQISGRAATAILGRFVASFLQDQRNISRRRSRKGDATIDFFPSPEAVLGAKESKLRAAGLSSAKVEAIYDLAAKTVEGVVPSTLLLRTLDDEEVIDRLTVVRGVGRWTVQMMLMFQLGRADVLPTADYGVRNGFRIAYRRRSLPTPGELQRFGKRWAPYRSAAAWYLWRAVDLEKAGVEWTRPRIVSSQLSGAARPRDVDAAPRRRLGERTR